ncbi:MAG: HAD hydrolase-like protein [Lachnospiraceae bacterium]|nr:HAD hydrolase-like protein [Lachnospiraceae bacterium]
MNILFPKDYYESAYVIPYEELWNNGYRGIIYDIDNTLVPHGAPADARSLELIDRLKRIGFEICLVSNNTEDRVDLFNKDAKVKYVFKAGKPLSKGYVKAMELMGTDKSTTFSVGDQIFTDVIGTNNAGIRSIMVKLMDRNEPFNIILKRILEAPILMMYFLFRGRMKK